ncbi:metallo-beta-lactamase superfamily protein [Saccharothrix carnea]|uniref:Metallo-beta-lactamase superfamily protein n=1 Tax=Saccharothrix carnea TaxID=1280637 RepID=A0A2P8I6H7_SACCR|nr:MBL fold metallo-hydrolase [Saccharothrix carnea]PSL54055.1 metallo-beta-lactamase superfamily protein [Saccharothrix carnea]
MKVHHLNCGTMRPLGGKLVTGEGSYFSKTELVCHVLLLETDDGLTLVDSGMGVDDVRTPDDTLARSWRLMSRPALDERETALRQVEALGFTAADVRTVVLTHLDLDHGGGLRDFPHADVHLSAEELAAATGPHKSRNDRIRYPDEQWEHGPRWVPHETTGETWFGFDGVREVSPDVLLVPLFGHTHGHTGVAVRDGDRWLLHAGDSYFFHAEMTPKRYCPPALTYMQKRMQVLPELRVANQERLRELVRDHGAEVDVFSAHDATELRRHQDRAAVVE